jgi:hypothetical protein
MQGKWPEGRAHLRAIGTEGCEILLQDAAMEMFIMSVFVSVMPCDAIQSSPSPPFSREDIRSSE